MNVLHLIESETLLKNGCTYSLPRAELILPGYPYYSLSLHKDLEEIIPIEEFSIGRIKMFIIKNSELLWYSDVCVGTWVHEGNVYLDVSSLFSKEATTIEELKSLATDQIAAWDFELSQEIKL